MLVLQVKNDIRLIDSDLGVPKGKHEDIKRFMVDLGLESLSLTVSNPFSTHDYVTYTLYQMVDEYFEGLIAIGESDWCENEKDPFVNNIYDRLLGIINNTNKIEKKLILNEVLVIKDANRKDHELHIRVQSAVVINQ